MLEIKKNNGSLLKKFYDINSVCHLDLKCNVISWDFSSMNESHKKEKGGGGGLGSGGREKSKVLMFVIAENV